MAAQTGVRGLGTDELQAIRDGLAAGRKPRVMFTESAGQIAGQVGQVVALTDPAESEEWVVVKFGRDELPFSPADLEVAPKGPVKKAAPPVPEPRVEPEFVLAAPPPPPVVEEPAPVAAPAPAPRKAAARPAKAAKPPAGLTVTLAYADGEWTVAANQGAKALAKPYVVRPAEAMKIVALVDVPGVREAVEQIVSVERAEVEKEADRLRAELAEMEARLQELREAG
ncbi:hypothetical protein [Actinoplanes sp. NPDC051494]|uniref:hypothetical protein n=1 Tax=Actinoplanes sp. NPDC051494 TaxID=3363907 RepID=UPI0037A5F894